MATQADARAIARHLDGGLAEAYATAISDPRALRALQVELDRFTMGNVPANEATARLVALAFVRRFRLALAGPARDRIEDYLEHAARGRIPEPKAPNRLSNVVHVASDPYDDWGQAMRRFERLVPEGRASWLDFTALLGDVLAVREVAKLISEARSIASGDWIEQVVNKVAPAAARTLVGWLYNSATSAMQPVLNSPSTVFVDTATERAEDWAARYAGRLVADVTTEQEKSLRAVILKALEDGTGPEEMAWRIRTSGLGLHGRWATAVDGYYHDQIGEGVKRGIARANAERYAAHLKDVRADVIARTETMYSMNWGRMILWNAAQQREDLPADTQKRWVTALDERVCPICKPMNNQIVDMRDNFRAPANVKARDIFLPPAHPNCRCIMVLHHPNEAMLPAVA